MHTVVVCFDRNSQISLQLCVLVGTCVESGTMHQLF